MALILAFGPHSGAHMNPVVTLAAAVLDAARRITAGADLSPELAGYLLAELGPGRFVDLVEVTDALGSCLRIVGRRSSLAMTQNFFLGARGNKRSTVC